MLKEHQRPQDHSTINEESHTCPKTKKIRGMGSPNQRPHLLAEEEDQELRELGAVGVENRAVEGVQHGVPGGRQLSSAASALQVLEHQAHQRVQLQSGL